MPRRPSRGEWAQVAQAISQARDLGYGVVAVNQTIQGRLTSEHLGVWRGMPAIAGAQLSWSTATGRRISDWRATGQVGRGSIRVVRRVTAVISDAAHGHSLSCSGSGSAAGDYDIVAVRPVSEKLLYAASNGSWDGVDVISLAMGARWGFFAKHKTVGQALALGIAFEIAYDAALAADAAVRQQWVSNAAALVRVTRGRGVVVTSAARQAFGLRSPYDVVHLGDAVQLNADLTKRCVSSNARAVLVHGFTRVATHRAAVSVVLSCGDGNSGGGGGGSGGGGGGGGGDGQPGAKRARTDGDGDSAMAR
ncbi:RNase P subunit p30-domain-containing protein [Kickxella alabastrina]|uniref:RNase P subunit p30-domain-containing protein n=1 Tax=Kickxella alabastrina TaxID=61397 RepID=UPI00221F63F4|nr:RNase P subunit p30-domain-containing protein [Kickxella alabastrina]KAI7829998.1 RNase P subunit p30-domain-containing protein [Kickxella alabastrina]